MATLPNYLSLPLKVNVTENFPSINLLAKRFILFYTIA